MSSGSLSGRLSGAEVLVIDSDTRVHEGIKGLVEEDGLFVQCVTEPKSGIDLATQKYFTVCLVDLDTPDLNGGLPVIKKLGEVTPTSTIVALSPRKSFEDGIAAIRAGAVDVVVKVPDSVDYLREIILSSSESSISKRDVDAVWTETSGLMERFLELLMAAEREVTSLKRKGPPPLRSYELLLVTTNADIAMLVSERTPKNLQITHASSGGEGLDKGTSGDYDMVLVGTDLMDLPADMIISSVQSGAPESVLLEFGPPGPGAEVSLIESQGKKPIITDFTDPDQLVARLEDFAKALRAKEEERKHTQAFRQKHYDFLRRFVSVNRKLKEFKKLD